MVMVMEDEEEERGGGGGGSVGRVKTVPLSDPPTPIPVIVR
jgi:hypothetical protein